MAGNRLRVPNARPGDPKEFYDAIITAGFVVRPRGRTLANSRNPPGLRRSRPRRSASTSRTGTTSSDRRQRRASARFDSPVLRPRLRAGATSSKAGARASARTSPTFRSNRAAPVALPNAERPAQVPRRRGEHLARADFPSHFHTLLRRRYFLTSSLPNFLTRPLLLAPTKPATITPNRAHGPNDNRGETIHAHS